MSAIEYLESLQREYYRLHGNHSLMDSVRYHSDMNVLDSTELHESMLFVERFHLSCQQTPRAIDFSRFTKYENLTYKHLFWYASEAALQGMTDMNIDPPQSRIVFCALPRHEPNAFVTSVPNESLAIIFNTGMFKIMSAIVQSIVIAMPETKGIEGGYYAHDINPSIEKLLENDRAVSSFKCAINDYRNNRFSQNGLIPFDVNDHRLWLYLDMYITSVTFIMAHEYAHVIFNHKFVDGDSGQMRVREYESGKREVWNLSNSQIQEIQADQLGTWITLHAFAYKKDFSSICMGIEVFLSAVAIIEAIQEQDAQSSHPNSNDRRNEIIAAVRESIGNKVNEVIPAIKDVNRISTYLWEATQE